MGYATNVFINCPYDPDYKTFMDAMVFAICDCGFAARSALELSDSSVNRLDKILDIIAVCRLGIHDISATELNKHGLPRFNMPFELGLFLAAKRFGRPTHRRKACLILDRDPYRYKEFLSDLGGHDIAAHEGKEEVLVRRVRDWLNQHRPKDQPAPIPGGSEIWKRYEAFTAALPALCVKAFTKPEELGFLDYNYMIFQWIKETTGTIASPTP